MKVTVKPMSDAQVWQLVQDVQNAYRAALKPPLILPSGLEGWLKDATSHIGYPPHEFES